MMKNFNLIYTLVHISYLTQFVVHVAQLPLRVDLKQQLLVAYQRACCKVSHEYKIQKCNMKQSSEYCVTW